MKFSGRALAAFFLGVVLAVGTVETGTYEVLRADVTATCTSTTETAVAGGLVRVVCVQASPSAAPTATVAPTPLPTPTPVPTPTAPNGAAIELRSYISELPGQSSRVPGRGFTVGWNTTNGQSTFYPVDTSRASFTNNGIGVQVGVYVDVFGFRYPGDPVVYAYGVTLANSPFSNSSLPGPCGPGVPGENQPITSACPAPTPTPVPTAKPSATPTAIPTAVPTATATPTTGPSAAPTDMSPILTHLRTSVKTSDAAGGCFHNPSGGGANCATNNFAHVVSSAVAIPYTKSAYPSDAEAFKDFQITAKYVDEFENDNRAADNIQNAGMMRSFYIDGQRLYKDNRYLPAIDDRLVAHDTAGNQIFLADNAPPALLGDFGSQFMADYFATRIYNQMHEYNHLWPTTYVRADDMSYPGGALPYQAHCSGYFANSTNIIYQKNSDGSYKLDSNGNKIPVVFDNSGDGAGQPQIMAVGSCPASNPKETKTSHRYYADDPSVWYAEANAWLGKLGMPMKFNGCYDPETTRLFNSNVIGCQMETVITGQPERYWIDQMNMTLIGQQLKKRVEWFTWFAANQQEEYFAYASSHLVTQDPFYMSMSEEAALHDRSAPCTSCTGYNASRVTSTGGYESFGISPLIFIVPSQPIGPDLTFPDSSYYLKPAYNPENPRKDYGVGRLQKSGGAYAREFLKVYVKGVLYGRYAVVLNPTNSTVPMPTLSVDYPYTAVASGHGVIAEFGDTGSIAISGGRAPSTLAPGTGYLMFQRNTPVGQ